MNIYVIENQYDSVVDLLNVYALNRDVRINPMWNWSFPLPGLTRR